MSTSQSMLQGGDRGTSRIRRSFLVLGFAAIAAAACGGTATQGEELPDSNAGTSGSSSAGRGGRPGRGLDGSGGSNSGVPAGSGGRAISAGGSTASGTGGVTSSSGGLTSSSGGTISATGGSAGATQTAGQGNAGGSAGSANGDATCELFPDESQYLKYKTSGGLLLDVHLTGAEVHRGSEEGCNGAWNKDNSFSLGFFVPVPIEEPDDNPTGIASLTAQKFAPGEVGNGKAITVSLLSTGHIWTSSDACTLDVKQNQKLGSGRAYAITGTVKCKQAVPDVANASPLTIEVFDFAATAYVNP